MRNIKQKTRNIFYLLLYIIFLQACFGGNSKPKNNAKAVWSPTKKVNQELKKAYFASGCFWCVEAIFESVKGVKEVYSGYSGGETKNPNYRQIGTGRTGHAETVEVIYDPSVVSFITLVKVFFGSHDPTALNRQGPDSGTQYRSIAFFQNEKEKKILEKAIKILTHRKKFKNKIVTEVKPFEKFYYAEEYHQDFEKRNPNHPYIRSVSVPRFQKFQARFPELLKAEH